MRYGLSPLVLLVLAALAQAQQTRTSYPPLPEAFSSFGAAVVDGYVYVYGGHTGKTHTYSTASVTGKFRRLNLGSPQAWEELPGGIGLQGLALVAHGSKLYRIGGMQPRNAPGETADNISTAACAAFDPKLGKWQPLPDMPAGRSSHDATVVDDTIVVVGGWQMNGAGGKNDWHKTALVLDLSKTPPQWESIPQPFQRRALNVAACDGLVYAVCGMAPEGDMDKAVDVLDLKTRKWSSAPGLPGPIRNGFTPAACNAGGKLYVSPADGKVYRLSEKKDAWDEVAALAQQRIVHRLVPAGDELLMVLGGAARSGNVASVEAIEPACCVKPKAVAARNPHEQGYCPVMTTVPIDGEAKEVEYRGVKIKVCCSTCLRKWNADPEAYLNVALLPQLKGMALPPRTLAQVYCPVHRDRVVSAKSPAAEYNGATVYFFSETARTRFLEDPTRYADVAVLPQLRR
jgi:YHS domain-containing protein/N-acetylneuraminic acid mutarotase